MQALSPVASPPDDVGPPANPRSLILLLAAGGVYQCVLALTDGRFNIANPAAGAAALAVACLANALVIAALVRSRRVATGSTSAARAVTVAGVALIAQVACAARISWFWTGIYRGEPTIDEFQALAAASGPIMVLAGMALLAPAKAARRLLWTIAALHLAMGAFVAARTGAFIDVQLFQKGAAEALLSGDNPYAITYANPYVPPGQPDAKSSVYSAEVQSNGRLLTGFVYLPLSLLAVLPGHVLGDVRYADAAALAAAGLMIGLVARGRAGRCAAILMLTAPAGWRVVQAAFTEPLMMFALGGLALAAARGWRVLPVLVGLFFASKQYTAIYVPLLWLLLPRPLTIGSSARFLGLAAASAAAVTLPLALWDVRAFWHSAFSFHFAQPFRLDSLSLISLYVEFAGGRPPGASAIAFGALACAWAIALIFAPRNAAGFTLGVAVATPAYFLFSGQAFLNYHSFAAYAILLSVATLEAARGAPAVTRPVPSAEAPAAAPSAG